MIGLTEEVEESQMNGTAALTGCSVAWFYMMIEALCDGALKNGVPRSLSYSLAAKAMEGAAKMVLETGKHPGEVNIHFLILEYKIKDHPLPCTLISF